MRLTEDEIYRSSTQFRLWSFTPEALASLRADTNATAAARVKAAVKRLREARANNGDVEKNGTQNGTVDTQPLEKEVDCLTVEEEQKVVDAYCKMALTIGQQFKYPTNVTATGVQYIKRFYLFNSPMTYAPKAIMRSAMFLAHKTENYHTTAAAYAQSLCTEKNKTTPEEILAPEYLITQALRFTFDVRHPHRGLDGGHMELLSIARGHAAVLPSANKSANDIQTEMLSVPTQPNRAPSKMTIAQLEQRIGAATGTARQTLKTSAITTDAYFLYSPAQIWLAAYLLADEPLTSFYISTKFPSDSIDSVTPSGVAKTKLLSTVKACAALLREGAKLLEEDTTQAAARVQEIKAIEKKLRHCRDPDKMDLVKLNKATKRDAGADGKLEESVAKRRKLEREKNQIEMDEFWGPELPKNGSSTGTGTPAAAA